VATSVQRRFANAMQVERVVINAFEMRLCRLIFAALAMASSSGESDPP
jgi:hypothetical protein